MIRLKINKLWIMLGIVIIITGSSAEAISPEFWGGDAAVKALSTVNSRVIEQMENTGQSDFFIVLSEQADLSGAAKIYDKTDKGRYVFKQLRAVSERTQPQLIHDLDLGKQDIQRFHIQNMILVRNGNPDQLITAANNPQVRQIHANDKFVFKNDQPMAFDANEPTDTPEWSLSHIGITDVWAEGYDGTGIVVANLDTGVDWDHPALKSHYRGWDGSTASHDYNWHDTSTSCGATPCDTGDHGTHTMGTMVGEDPSGVNQVGGAPGAQWIACAPLEDAAGFHECFEWFLAPYGYGQSPGQGLPAKAPDIVNNSWGWPVGGGDYQYAPDIDALQAAGVFMEFSAGNEGDYCETLRSPGDYPQVLTTGASDSQDRIVSESWTYWGSSRGPATSGIPGAPDFIKPEITAPGYDIRSSVPGGGYEGGWGGTSMAGPHTCAVIALLWDAAPGLIGDIATTRQIVIDTAYVSPSGTGAGYWNQTCEGINASTTIPNHVWGWGLIDAYAAFQALAGVYLDKPMYRPNDSMVISVRDSNSSGSVTVEVTSDVETDIEYVTLNEVGTGDFEGSFLTTSNGAVHGDGAISVNNGSMISVYYPALDMTTTATVDGDLPVISNVSIDEITASGMTVSWTTDELARSIVMYGEGAPSIEVRDETLTTSHSLTLTGLDDCTYYLLDIMAEDQAGNIGVDNNGGAHYNAQTYELTVFLNADMDTDPGWSYDGQWAWGQPTGQGGSYGYPDPENGYTGSNVVGYNLNGDYTNSMTNTHWATTPSFDCSAATIVNFTFWAWLGVESPTYDHAYIEVSNNNGSSWTTIWENTATLEAGQWDYWEFDISNQAAGYGQVMVRWGIGPTDSGWTYCGWNIDDVSVSYEQPCQSATPTPNPTVTPAPTNTPEECNNDGDPNFDDEITAGDAQMGFQIALGAISPTEDEACAADCNGDGEVTAGDAQQMFMAALGSDTCADPI